MFHNNCKLRAAFGNKITPAQDSVSRRGKVRSTIAV